MTGGQLIYIAGLITLVIVAVIGSLMLPMSAFTLLLLAIFAFVGWFRKEITPEGEEPQTPLTILRDSPVWQMVGVAYTLLLVGVVGYHLGVERIGLFEKINMPVFLVLIFGGLAGPIAVHIRRTYRLMGGKKEN